jgi:hypothetical protein
MFVPPQLFPPFFSVLFFGGIGTGFAYVHNEFHGEQAPHNKSYCSFQSKTSTGQCILWSTDLATTANGGHTWQLAHSPLITLPRPYVKDAPIAGYGELGAIIRHDDGMCVVYHMLISPFLSFFIIIFFFFLLLLSSSFF